MELNEEIATKLRIIIPHLRIATSMAKMEVPNGFGNHWSSF